TRSQTVTGPAATQAPTPQHEHALLHGIASPPVLLARLRTVSSRSGRLARCHRLAATWASLAVTRRITARRGGGGRGAAGGRRSGWYGGRVGGGGGGGGPGGADRPRRWCPADKLAQPGEEGGHQALRRGRRQDRRVVVQGAAHAGGGELDDQRDVELRLGMPD